MGYCPNPILADIGDLAELLIPLAFIFVYAIAGAVKKWSEGSEVKERKKSLENIHSSKSADRQNYQQRQPARTQPKPALQQSRRSISPSLRGRETLPYATAYPEKPKPAPQAKQSRLSELQKKRAEYLSRISGQISSSQRQEQIPYASPAAARQKSPLARSAKQTPARAAVMKPAQHVKPAKVMPKRMSLESSRKSQPIRYMLYNKKNLQAAILVSEILGKPVSLKESGMF